MGADRIRCDSRSTAQLVAQAVAPQPVGEERLVDDDILTVAGIEVIRVRGGAAVHRVVPRSASETGDVSAFDREGVVEQITVEQIVAIVAPKVVDVQSTLQ